MPAWQVTTIFLSNKPANISLTYSDVTLLIGKCMNSFEKLASSSSDCSLTSIKTGSSFSELNQSLRLEAFIDFG